MSIGAGVATAVGEVMDNVAAMSQAGKGGQ